MPQKPVTLAIVLFLSNIGPSHAQSHPSFEVASIKPGDSDNQNSMLIVQKGGRFRTMNISLKMIIAWAYDVRNHQIAGGPNWLDSAKYDIDAKSDSGTPIPPGQAGFPQMRLMVQALLVDRFKLAIHRETKPGPVYELVVAKGGTKLKEAPDAEKRLGLRMPRQGQINGTKASLSQLVNQLSDQLGRSIIDKTGLTGNYDFTLHWTPDSGEMNRPDMPPPDPDAPSIFTALQEQVGLRLESAKGPVEVLVVDHAEKHVGRQSCRPHTRD